MQSIRTIYGSKGAVQSVTGPALRLACSDFFLWYKEYLMPETEKYIWSWKILIEIRFRMMNWRSACSSILVFNQKLVFVFQNR